jgi:F5/8 type C domain-containing protein
MKTCPKCPRTYDDETLRFCLEDGSPLFDARDSAAPATEILPPRGTPTLKSSGPANPTYPSGNAANFERPPTRSSNSILTVGVIAIALLLLALVAIAGVFLFRQSSDKDAGAAQTGTPGPTSTPAKRDDASTPAELAASSTQSNTPLKINASSSSNRLAVQANTYYPANAIDGKKSTAWIEGVDGAGIGEWIRFDFDREITLHRILWQPGYFKSPMIWSQNNRLASVTAEFSDGSSREINFSDQMASQKTDIGSVRTKWVRFVIKSVYYGTDPDTALSELAFEWEP